MTERTRAATPSTRAVIALLALACVLMGCTGYRAATIPMRTLELRGGSGGKCLAVLLPGRWDRPERFARAGFAETIARRGLPLDLVAADAHVGYYRDRSVIARLREDVILPARAAGYEEIWLVGVSLGGLGSLFYLREHPDEIAGVLALAPYLGEEATLREIEAAGGPVAWSARATPGEATLGRELWSWLGPWADGRKGPPLFLGWGRADALAPANEMLATLLPEGRADAVSGGHDWTAWAHLWERFLERTEICPDEK